MVRLVILAAGKSTRMGSDKLALPWGASTVLAAIVKKVLKAAASCPLEVVVVAAKPIRSYLNPSLTADFQTARARWLVVGQGRPLSANIGTGIGELNPGIRGVGFLPGDQVGVDSHVLARMINYFLRDLPDFLVPWWQGSVSSPVIFKDDYVTELLGLTGEQGGREVLKRYRHKWTKFPVNKGFVRDVDTWEEYCSFKGELDSELKLNGGI